MKDELKHQDMCCPFEFIPSAVFDWNVKDLILSFGYFMAAMNYG